MIPDDVIQWTAAASAVAGLIAAAVKFAISHSKSVSKIIDLADKTEVILKELKPNGGNSFRDAVNRIEKKLHESEGFVKTVLAHKDIAFFESDAKGDCRWVNGAYLTLFKKSIGDITQDGWKSCLYSDNREIVIKEWETCVADSREFIMDYYIVNGENAKVFVHCKALPYKDDKGNLLGYLGTIIPIEEPKKKRTKKNKSDHK